VQNDPRVIEVYLGEPLETTANMGWNSMPNSCYKNDSKQFND
jgi:hypothetical protein